MLSKYEKQIVEKFIEFHKEKGGTVTHDMRHSFISLNGIKGIKNSFFDINPIIDKSIAIGLLKYTLSDRTGMTSLTEKGWNFKSFEEHEKAKLNQQEIDKITIEKLKTDLVNSKRQARMFFPLTILTFILGIITIYTSVRSIKTNNSLEQIRLKQNITDSVLNSLNNKLKRVNPDTSKYVSKSLIPDRK